MGKAKPTGSESIRGSQSCSKRGRQTLKRDDDREIARSNDAPDDSLNAPGQGAAGTCRGKLSSQRLRETSSSSSAISDPSDSEVLTAKQAAAFLNLSESFLAKARMTGGGPDYLKLGSRAVRYRKTDLEAWLKKNSKTSTSQY